MKCSSCQGAEATVRIPIGKATYPLCGGCAIKLDAVGKTVKGLARLAQDRERTKRDWQRA